MYVDVRWSMAGHEGEYVVHLPATLESVRIPGFQNDPRYHHLKELLVPRLSDYMILDRGTRIEIVGERNDDLVHDAFFGLGYIVNSE
jgi:hypothetical protein